MLNKKHQRGEYRLRAVETWLDQFGAMVWAVDQIWHGAAQPPVNVFEDTFIELYRRFSSIRRFPSARSAVLYYAIQACVNAKESELAENVHRASTQVGDSAKANVSETTACSMPWEGELEAICRLTQTQKWVAVCYLFHEGDMHTLSRTLSRPRAFVLNQLDAASKVLWSASDTFASAQQKWVDLRTKVQVYLEQLCVPEAVQVRARKMLMASAASMQAEHRQRGPRWVKYGMVLAGAVALAAIAYGAQGRVQSATVSSAAAGDASMPPKPTGLPSPISNFPGRVLAQFLLENHFDIKTAAHMAITKNSVYLPELTTVSDTWPSVVINRCDMAKSGQSLEENLERVGQVDLIPPTHPAASSGKSAAPVGWVVKEWRFYVTGSWGIVVANWVPHGASGESVTQLYALYLPTGKASLVKTFDNKSASDQTVVAVGAGKIVVQSAIDGAADQPQGQASLSLPVDVYTLSGHIPLQALGEPKHIPAPFGLMQDPVITGDRLIFQGIRGQVQPEDNINATWYGLSWDGQLARFDGPPLDGQPHWPVTGASGALWWAETTPDDSHQSSMQVLMHPLTGTDAVKQTPAQTLAQSVQFFTASDQYVAWVQSTEGVTQLVVGELP
jgi:hypothetical protein